MLLSPTSRSRSRSHSARVHLSLWLGLQREGTRSRASQHTKRTATAAATVSERDASPGRRCIDESIRPRSTASSSRSSRRQRACASQRRSPVRAQPAGGPMCDIGGRRQGRDAIPRRAALDIARGDGGLGIRGPIPSRRPRLSAPSARWASSFPYFAISRLAEGFLDAMPRGVHVRRFPSTNGWVLKRPAALANASRRTRRYRQGCGGEDAGAFLLLLLLLYLLFGHRFPLVYVW